MKLRFGEIDGARRTCSCASVRFALRLLRLPPALIAGSSVTSGVALGDALAFLERDRADAARDFRTQRDRFVGAQAADRGDRLRHRCGRDLRRFDGHRRADRATPPPLRCAVDAARVGRPPARALRAEPVTARRRRPRTRPRRTSQRLRTYSSVNRQLPCARFIGAVPRRFAEANRELCAACRRRQTLCRIRNCPRGALLNSAPADFPAYPMCASDVSARRSLASWLRAMALRCGAALAGAIAAAALPAWRSRIPTQAGASLVVPFPPGGPLDVVGRARSRRSSTEAWGQSGGRREQAGRRRQHRRRLRRQVAARRLHDPDGRAVDARRQSQPVRARCRTTR